jgi:hypothetical protein
MTRQIRRARRRSGTIGVERIVTPRDAELVAAEWMILMGFRDARVTQQSNDGGYDVVARTAVAEVKWQERPTPPKDIRALNGVKGARQAMFFSGGGYSKKSIEFAFEHNIALFMFTSYDGSLLSCNSIADALLSPIATDEPGYAQRTSRRHIRNRRQEERRAAAATQKAKRARDKKEAAIKQARAQEAAKSVAMAEREQRTSDRVARRSAAASVRREARASRKQHAKESSEARGLQRRATVDAFRMRRRQNSHNELLSDSLMVKTKWALAWGILGIVLPFFVFGIIAQVQTLNVRRRITAGGALDTPRLLKYARRCSIIGLVLSAFWLGGTVASIAIDASGSSSGTSWVASLVTFGTLAVVFAVCLVMWRRALMEARH